MSLFRPAFNYRWIGNIKKYHLDPFDGDILDALGSPAVDPASGFFFAQLTQLLVRRAPTAPTSPGAARASKIASGTTLDEVHDQRQRHTVELDSAATARRHGGLNIGIQTGDYVRSGSLRQRRLTPTNLLEWFYGRDVAGRRRRHDHRRNRARTWATRCTADP